MPSSCCQTINVVEEAIQDTVDPGVILRLGIKSLKASDGGEYRCEAENNAGKVQGIAKLEVFCKYWPTTSMLTTFAH